LNQVYQPGYLKWLHREFFKLLELATEVGPVLEKSIAIGAVNRWISGQDLLMVPSQLQLLKAVYDCEDPKKVLFHRIRLEDKGV